MKTQITHDGETLTLAEWSRRTKIPYMTLRSRIYHSHWPAEKALTTPVGRTNRTKVEKMDELLDRMSQIELQMGEVVKTLKAFLEF
jgi:hypothetical protein